MIYLSLAIGIIMIIFLSYATCGLWTRYINTKTVNGFLIPGTIVHELSHALLCLVTGTTIKEMNLFTSNNTGIKQQKPKIALIFFFLEKLGVHLQQYKWWNFCIKELWVITALTISVLATLLFITLVTMGLIKGYRLTFGHKSSPK